MPAFPTPERAENQVFADCPALRLTPEVYAPSARGAIDGSVVLQVAGGQPPYQYYLYNVGQRQNLKVATTENAFGQLAEGHYLAVVSDASGCLSSVQFSVTTPNKQ